MNENNQDPSDFPKWVESFETAMAFFGFVAMGLLVSYVLYRLFT